MEHPAQKLRPREGTGQIAMIGPPNSWKSSVLARLTRAHPEIAEYLFTTTAPHPGMMPYEGVQVQLVDTPPLAAEQFDPVLVNIARNADAVLLVLDAGAPEGLEHVELIRRFLARCRIVPQGREVPEGMGVAARVQPVLVALNKSDVDRDGVAGDLILEALRSDLPSRRIAACGSGASGDAAGGNNPGPEDGCEALRWALFRVLDVLRVYAKEPGKKPDMDRPFVMKRGATAMDLAEVIHKDFVTCFRFARIWGSARFDGQPVERHHVLEDRDVVEIHT